MGRRGMRAIGAALLVATVAIAGAGISSSSAAIDWIYSSMTVTVAAKPTSPPPGGSGIGVIGGPGSGGSLVINATAHATGKGPVLVGFGSSFGGSHYNVAVFDDRSGGVRLRTTEALGGIDIEIEPAGDGKFSLGSAIAGSTSSFANLLFLTNAVIDGYKVEATGGTPVTHTGSGSQGISAVAPDNGGIGVDASAVAAGATSFGAAVPTGLVGGVIWDSCTRCTTTWKSPDGKTGTSDHTVLPRLPLPIPIPGGVVSGDLAFAGPAGEWEWTWTGATVSSAPSPTMIAAYAPIGELWKEFTGATSVRPAAPAPAKPKTNEPAEVHGSKETRGSLAATGVGSTWLAAVSLLTVAVLVGRRLRVQ